MRFLLTAIAVLLFAMPAGADPKVGLPAPEVSGDRWINSAPLTMASLRGRVVLVEFWTYG